MQFLSVAMLFLSKDRHLFFNWRSFEQTTHAVTREIHLVNKTKQPVQGTSKLTHCHIEQRVELDSILINAVGGRVKTLSNMTQKNMFEPIDFNTWRVKAAV